MVRDKYSYYLIRPKTSLFFSFYGASWSFILSLSIIYACFYACSLEFSFYPLSLFHPKSTLALALRVRDDTAHRAFLRVRWQDEGDGRGERRRLWRLFCPNGILLSIV